MNCIEFRDHLAAGDQLNNSATEHLRNCAACREMVQAFGRTEELPDGSCVEAVRRRIFASLRPVRPLPSDREMAVFALILFLAFSVVAAAPFGYRGFHGLDGFQRFFYYVTIAVLGVLFSAGTVQEMVPGAKRRVYPRTLIVATLISLSILVILIFRTFALRDFVKTGVPCLLTGSIVAALSALLGFAFVRRGYFTSPVQAGLIVGCFTGLSGVAMLALACPIQDAGHTIIWHLGVLVISTATGAALGKLSTFDRGIGSLAQS